MVNEAKCSRCRLTPFTKPPGKIARFHPCLAQKKDHNQKDNEGLKSENAKQINATIFRNITC